MRVETLFAVLRALNQAEVRYLVAGGVAVNAHGYIRSTHDIDLAIALDRDNVASTFEALAARNLAYRPLLPVTAAQFADESTRRNWVEDKNMLVLSFSSDVHRETRVDLFTHLPFEFETEWRNCYAGAIGHGVEARFISLDTLIDMKRRAGRHRDLDDLEHLTAIREDGK